MKHVFPRFPNPVARFRLVRTVIVSTFASGMSSAVGRVATALAESNGIMSVDVDSRGGTSESSTG